LAVYFPLGRGFQSTTGTVFTIRRFTRRDAASGQSQPPCLVCLAPDPELKLVKNKNLGKEQNVRICGQCGYVQMPENTHDYTTATSTNNLGMAPRCGTEDRPGREFGMARLGIDVLGRSGLGVMVYGVGRSMDNLHIAKQAEVRRTVIGDIMKIRDDGEFIDISGPATESFDIVVASEVIEHFPDPREEFAKLFGWVAPGGILVCSTNIHDGGQLDQQRYIFGRGHVSYYSPESLRTIARANDMQVDFRLPVMASGEGGLRKRYVIFTRDQATMDAVSDYFGRHPYAPSEPAGLVKKRSGAKQRGAAKRPGPKRPGSGPRAAGPAGRSPNAPA
jgi:SAM-dependent methyltransferase